MSNKGCCGIGDTGCRLLLQNLPGLSSLNLCSNLANIDSNSLSSLAVQSLSQLRQLVELNISSDTEIQLTITSAMRLPNFWQESHSSPNYRSVVVMDNAERTEITQKGLLVLSRLSLTDLNIGKGL